ncbi:RING/Ubox like zinc-binding domain-containing protein [Blyttiomyces helicus]|uniref:RING/Ubox like zinc-binding domain-containing protein n=1 Tax=Blyttiomyces helicus TaxID=388810 RepID=A0A4P9WHL6_9FUNG|nr:RING/Ubox like zinc-binding domain-containing protein [Blyttiomyces helicus]|eukprot:RKO90918.1 RING/Ubox like zinc-binding domain-containing protein [Blyttiomyces helicus]
MSLYSDEDDEMECCPLCITEIDIADKYFKPCPCEYQVCRFCWNHIKEDLNGLCPGCRRPYLDENVQFKPVTPDELARLSKAKKQKEKERKEQEIASKRHLATRVVLKNLVYVTGLPARILSEETLRSPDFFGQFGKITKVVLAKNRTTSYTPVVVTAVATGTYLLYARKEDAAKAIEAVDGAAFEGKAFRAMFGASKYCPWFLKGRACSTPNCTCLHESGEDADSFLREEAG